MSDGIDLAGQSALGLGGRTHESAVFEARVRPLMAPLLGYFVRRIDPAEEAADCLSEVLAVMWRRRRELPGADEQVRRWAYGIAKGVLANAVRGKVRRTALADRVRAQVPNTTIDTTAEDIDVHRALEQLSEQDQELIRLVVWDGFGIAEAGALLHLRPEAARSRYARARQRLKDLLC